MKMTDTSLDTLETSYDTNTASQPTDTTLSDDDDDELLALRIAALESIKLQKAKPSPLKETAKQPEADGDKPEFQIKKHSIRSNLLSIVTHNEEQETAVPPPSNLNPEAAPFIPVPVHFDPSRPPPGFGGRGGQLLPFPPRPRSPGYRRYSSRSRSRSPGPRRRPLSRSPPPGYFRRRSVSPYRRRRSLSPLDRRSPPLRRRSPPPPRKSRTPEKPRSPSPSEWETDTEGESEAEQEEEEEKKEEPEVKTEEKKPVAEKKEKDIGNDDDGDDFLKLDATAEEDEFSAFLNEFEDEVLAKKEDKKKPEKKEKKVRLPTEKKIVDGKKLRKKIKPKKETPPPAERRSQSPRLTRSPGRRYFSPNRNKDGRFSPRRRDDRASQDRLRANKSRERDIKSRERDNKSKEKVINKDIKPVESAAERAEREQREYEERIAKLPTPERERMEARRKKFDKKIDPNKKISLKSDKAEEEVSFDVRKRINRASADPDKGDDRRSRSPVRKNVTDLRVALHKKRKAQEGDNDSGQKVKKVDLNSKHPLMRSTSLSPVDKGMDDLDEEDYGPVKKSNRMVVPPKKSKNIRNSEDESDRSPSPPEKLVTKKRKSSGDISDSLKNRRILVVRKGAGDSDQEEDFSITKRVSPNKGLKKSLHLRLGGKVGEELQESDIYMDILRKQEAKKKMEKEAKKAKKEKRKEKKEKKEKKKSKKKKGRDSESDEENLSDKHASDVDSGEELFRFFEEDQDSKKSKRRSGSPRRERQVSGKRFVRAKFADDDLDLELESLESRGRHGSGEGKKKIKDKLKRRTSNEGSLVEESLDVLEKMRRKNEKRLKRMKEIEKDKLMFS